MLAEVEAFLRDDARQLLLVHGFAGSGKSRFAQSMEEYICGAFHGAIAASDSYSYRVVERRGAHRSMTRRQGAFHDEMRERKRLPVLVWSNLAVLANPVANLLEESLRAPPLLPLVPLAATASTPPVPKPSPLPPMSPAPSPRARATLAPGVAPVCTPVNAPCFTPIQGRWGSSQGRTALTQEGALEGTLEGAQVEAQEEAGARPRLEETQEPTSVGRCI